MRDVWTVTKWEFSRGIKNKAFIVTILLIPIIIFVAAVVPRYLEKNKEQNLVIVDETAQVAEQVSSALAGQGVNVNYATYSEEELRKLAEETKKVSYLYIPTDFYENKQVNYYSQSSSEISLQSVQVTLDQIVKYREFNQVGLTNEQIAQLEEPVQVEQIRVDIEEEKDLKDFIVGQIGLVGFGFLIVFTSMMAGGMTLQGIIKEKNDRIVEILLSSISSRDLMAGKIIGNLFVGMVQMTGLGIIGLSIVKFVFKLPLGNLWSVNLLYMGIYAILAYILISTLYAFLGAIMKEVQSGGQVQPMLGIFPVVPMWFAGVIMTDPFGGTARLLSYIPFCTPMTMIMRIAATHIPFWEIGLTIVILLIFDIFMVYFVARIFKTGLLMYGKSAGFKEAWKWFKQAS